jgi:hypothetical protein
VSAKPVQVEHPELLSSASSLIGHLADTHQHLAAGETWYHVHTQFAERTESLALYLSGALRLVVNDDYAPAFSVVRSAMEHHVIDQLLFIGNRYASEVVASEDEIADLQAAVAEGRAGFEGVIAVEAIGKSRARVVRSGPHYTDQGTGPEAPSLSIYYSILDSYDPFTGGKAAHGFVGHWPFQEEHRREWASRQATTWRASLTWSSLCSSMRLNDFYSEVEIARWNVHYAFLSAFTHPTTRALESIYGHNSPKMYGYDHYASELLLLYIISLARLELGAFATMTDREPRVELTDWSGIEADLAWADRLTEHLWFPTGAPPLFDRVNEANRRGMSENGGLLDWAERPRPEELSDDEVMYYSNPLKRLAGMHAGINEITGFRWESAWPRSDAQNRAFD